MFPVRLVNVELRLEVVSKYPKREKQKTLQLPSMLQIERLVSVDAEHVPSQVVFLIAHKNTKNKKNIERKLVAIFQKLTIEGPDYNLLDRLVIIVHNNTYILIWARNKQKLEV